MTEEQDPRVEAFVNEAREATGEPSGAYDAFAFGDAPEMADALAALVVAGRKRATTSLLAEYEADDEPLPAIGAFGVVLDGAGRPVALIRTREVRIAAFGDVDEGFAWDEGEGDRTLRFWREGHRAFFARSDPGFSEDSPVVCERFDLVFSRATGPTAAPPEGSTGAGVGSD